MRSSTTKVIPVIYTFQSLSTAIYKTKSNLSFHVLVFPQLLRLLESFECHMITEVRKRVSRELTLAVAERAREEEALPTDLWKRTVSYEG